MTRVIFISVSEAKNERPYSDKTFSLRCYIVRDDTKFNRMASQINLESEEGRKLLEEVALKFDCIEREDVIDASAVFEWEVE